jgi:hypothetical protein
MIEIKMFQAVVNDRGHTQLFGISIDNKAYRWNYQDGKWELYLKSTLDK